MTAFVYEAVDVAGRRQRGTAEAGDARALQRTLEARGLLLLTVASADQTPRGTLRFGAQREVLEVTRALASLLGSGMPLARALQATQGLATGAVTPAVEDVRDRVERGEALADALARHPDLFDPAYVGLVRVGERSGELDATFTRLADRLERAAELKARLLSASLYPMLLAAFGGLSIVLLLLFVIPRFAELVEGAGAALPPTTAGLLWVSGVLRDAWPLLFALPLFAAAGAVWLRGTAEGRRVMARVLLHTPGVGSLRRTTLAARFARMLGTLLSGGAPLVAALGDTVRSLGDPIAAADAERVQGRVQEGASLHTAVGEGDLYPPLLAQLIQVGEESGRLYEFLLKAAAIFETRTERAVQRLLTVLEPAMIVGFGAVVALVALSLLQAIYGINADAFR